MSKHEEGALATVALRLYWTLDYDTETWHTFDVPAPRKVYWVLPSGWIEEVSEMTDADWREAIGVP